MSLPRLQFKAAIQLGWFKNPILIAPGHLWLWENQKSLLSGKPSPIKTEKILFSGRIWKLQIITDILPESSIPILRWALLQLRPKEWVGGDMKMNDFFFYCLKSKIYSHLSVQALLPSLEYWTPTIFQGLGAASSDQEKLFLLFSELPFYVGGEIDKIKKKKYGGASFSNTKKLHLQAGTGTTRHGGVLCKWGPETQALPFPSGSQPRHSSVGQTSTPKVSQPAQGHSIHKYKPSFFHRQGAKSLGPLSFDIRYLVNPIWSILDNSELPRILLLQGHRSDGLFVSQILHISTRQNLGQRMEVTARWTAQHKGEFPESQRYFGFKQRPGAQSTGCHTDDLCMKLSCTRSSLVLKSDP